MTLSDYFRATRDDISRVVAATLTEARECAPTFAGASGRAFATMEEFVLSGKMLRGILACLSSRLLSPTRAAGSAHAPRSPSPEALSLAAALEFFQAGLLVHDDIMDKDDVRRGKPTVHKTFERMELERGAPREGAGALGEALGICAGDIFYFIAWKLIAKLGPTMGALFSRELNDVCLAQMKDVEFGVRPEFPSLDEVLEVYTHKTARYTICLPLLAGAITAGREDAMPALEELGLNLGVLFQLQDDYLGLFGDEASLGKPVGSDIREGKKTPFILLLRPELTAEELERFEAIFGRKTISAEDVTYIRGLVTAHGVDARVRELSAGYAGKAEACLESLSGALRDIDADSLALLRDFISYSLSRTF